MQLQVQSHSKEVVQEWRLGWPYIGGNEMTLVAKAKKLLVVICQITEEGRIEQQGMIAIEFTICLLEANRGIVIVEKHRLPRLAHWHALTVDAGRVEHKRGSRGSQRLNGWERLEVFHLCVRHRSRMLLAMAAASIIEGTRPHIR